MNKSGRVVALVAAIFLVLMASTALESGPSVGLRVLLPTVLPHYCGDGRVFLVQVLANGSVKLNGKYTTRDGLATRLHEVYRTMAERVAFLEADPDVSFGRVADAIDVTQGQAKYVALITPSVRKELGQKMMNCLAIHP